MNAECLNDIDIPNLSADSKPILDQPISMQELYDSLISMKQNNTPVYDGFPIEFYVAFGQIFLTFSLTPIFSTENGLISVSQSNGIIILIPKKDKDCMYIY